VNGFITQIITQMRSGTPFHKRRWATNPGVFFMTSFVMANLEVNICYKALVLIGECGRQLPRRFTFS
jgi:hypothetical protein